MALKEGEKFNLETMEVEKVETPKAEEKQLESKTEESEEIEEQEEETPKSKKESDQEEEEQSEEEQEEESEEAEAKEEDQEEEQEEETDGVDADDYIKNEYGEKYEINSKEELDQVLDTMDEVMKDNETLKAEIEELKKGSDKPKFKSASQEKLWNYVKDIDPEKLGDRVQSFGRIVGMDLDKEDPKLLLEEQFIQENNELTREEAIKKFNREFNRKYSTVNRDDFETEEEYKEEIEMRKLDLKADSNKAKKWLAAKQKEFQTETKAEEGKPKVSEEVKHGIEANVGDLDNFMKDFSELVFSPTDDKEDDFSVKLSKEQISTIKVALKEWVSNPASYDAKGKIIGGFDSEEKVIQTAFLLFGPEIIQKNYEHALRLKDIMRAEEIGQRKPDRKAKVAGGNPQGSLTEEQQQDMIIKKKKQQRSTQSLVYR